LKRTNIVLAIVVVAALLTAIAGSAVAQKAAAKPQDKVALGEDEVKQLLLLMDADKNGMISKEEFMKFMEAEFERLDKDKSGELDVKELTQSRLRVARAAHGSR